MSAAITAPDVDALRRARPRSRLLRWSVVALAALVAYSWLSGDIAFDDLFTARRLANLTRFAGTEIRPYALRDEPFSLAAYGGWALAILREKGYDGALATLAISVLAISLAGLAGLVLAVLAARNVVTTRPFERSGDGATPRGRALRAAVALVRGLLVFLRAIPEYVWAYLLLAMLGATAWPAVLALAIHNSGILGKLGAETIENLETRPLRALSILGATRAQVVVAGVLPLSLARFLSYFFYRFETCVREATVLGMLGVVSLGYWIQDARSKQFYDEMLFLVVLGGLIVLAADLGSALVRAALRRAR